MEIIITKEEKNNIWTWISYSLVSGAFLSLFTMFRIWMKEKTRFSLNQTFRNFKSFNTYWTAYTIKWKNNRAERWTYNAAVASNRNELKIIIIIIIITDDSMLYFILLNANHHRRFCSHSKWKDHVLKAFQFSLSRAQFSFVIFLTRNFYLMSPPTDQVTWTTKRHTFSIVFLLSSFFFF